MKNKPQINRDVKIYTVELLVFAVIYLVLGILILTSVIPLHGTFRHILIYVSLVGAAWFVFDFFWTLFSKKRRKTSSLFDKALLLPAVIAVVVIDILTFTMGFEESNTLHVYFTGAFFCYLALIFTIEAIYHLYHPLPFLLEEEEGEKKAKEAAASPAQEEEKEEDFANKLQAFEKENRKKEENQSEK